MGCWYIGVVSQGHSTNSAFMHSPVPLLERNMYEEYFTAEVSVSKVPRTGREV